jgi:molybdopterin/thiamine biosynthesis adenylyltransferase
MASPFIHEVLYRGREAVERLGRAQIVICGAGALGSHLADNLVRQGVRRLRVVDMDRVEAHNLGTQLYEESDVGAYKAEIVRARCFRAVGIEIEAVARQLSERNMAKLLLGADLVVDTFDTAAARRLVTDHCRAQGLACLHLGMNADFGEVRWNSSYHVPDDVVAPDVCEYPLARNLVLFVVALGSDVALRFLLEGEQQSYSLTLRDLAINHEA